MARTEYRYNPIDLVPDKAVGIKLPFNGKQHLFELSYTTEEQAISNLKNLILTRKGERLMHPTFGTAIYDTLFENITEEFFVNIEDTLRSDIECWLPYIIINKIDASPLQPGSTKDYENGFYVMIESKVTETGSNNTIIIAFGNSQATIIEG